MPLRKVFMAAATSAYMAANATSGYLTQDEIDTFWQQGYVIKKSCVDRFHIHLLDQLTTHVLAKIQQECSKTSIHAKQNNKSPISMVLKSYLKKLNQKECLFCALLAVGHRTFFYLCSSLA